MWNTSLISEGYRFTSFFRSAQIPPHTRRLWRRGSTANSCLFSCSIILLAGEEKFSFSTLIQLTHLLYFFTLPLTLPPSLTLSPFLFLISFLWCIIGRRRFSSQSPGGRTMESSRNSSIASSRSSDISAEYATSWKCWLSGWSITGSPQQYTLYMTCTLTAIHLFMYMWIHHTCIYIHDCTCVTSTFFRALLSLSLSLLTLSDMSVAMARPTSW